MKETLVHLKSAYLLKYKCKFSFLHETIKNTPVTQVSHTSETLQNSFYSYINIIWD